MIALHYYRSVIVIIACIASLSVFNKGNAIIFCFAFSANAERRLVQDQLGYVPSNFVRVAAFCADGTALVIQTYPLAGGSPRRQARSSGHGQHGTPFPTLYWLCHAKVGRCLAELERRGCVAELQEILDHDVPLQMEWIKAHREYAVTRWNSLTETDRTMLLLLSHGDDDDGATASKRHILRDSGISGSNITRNNNEIPSIKCLHAQYAHYRASHHNPIGRLVHERLQTEFPSLIL